LFTLLAKVTVCELQVSGNEASSPNADRSMRKGKSPMNEPGEEQLIESELPNLKLHDNLETEIAHSIISDMVIPWNIISYPIAQLRRCSKFLPFVQYAIFNIKHENCTKTLLFF